MAAHDGIRAVLDGRLPSFTLEYPCHSPSVKRWFSMIVTPLGSGEKGVVIAHTNTTKRKLAEDALGLSEARFSTVFHASPVSIAITRLDDSQFIDVNEAWLNVTGVTREEAIGHTPMELNLWVSPSDRDSLIGILHEQDTVRDFEVQFRNKSAKISNMLMSAELIELAGEKCLLSLAQNITERKRSEELLREREEIYRAIVDQATEGIVLFDTETFGFIEFNDAACHGLGYSREEFAHLTLFDLQGVLTRKEVAERVQTLMKTGHGHFENRQRQKDGTFRGLLISNRVINYHGRKYIVGIWQDITERRLLEKEKAGAEAKLNQAQKLEALGTLAGGISHDFNNILAIMVGYTELAQADADDPKRVRKHLREVLQGANLAKGLVQQILAFSRRAEQEKNRCRSD